MFTRLVLEKYGPFKELDLNFPQEVVPGKAAVHIFTGPNGCGKSSLLRALSLYFHHEPINRRLLWDENGKIGVVFCEYNVAFNINPAEDSLKLWFFDIFKKVNRNTYLKFYNMGGWSSLTCQHSNLTVRHLKAGKPPCIAYSGRRGFIHENSSPVGEVSLPPAGTDANLERDDSSIQILQWVAFQLTREALALKDGNSGCAEAIGGSISRVEKIVSRITGINFSFSISSENLNVACKVQGTELKISVLPDGLKSILALISDLLMRLDVRGTTNPFEQEMVLLLDEIDIHLHPKWQRQILPVLQELFPNAQIFISTHSPFVVGSVSDAWVYSFKMNADGTATLDKQVKSMAGSSVSLVLDEIFDVDEAFDVHTEAELTEFYAMKQELLTDNEANLERFKSLARALSERSLELRDLVGRELRQISRLTQKEYSIA